MAATQGRDRRSSASGRRRSPNNSPRPRRHSPAGPSWPPSTTPGSHPAEVDALASLHDGGDRRGRAREGRRRSATSPSSARSATAAAVRLCHRRAISPPPSPPGRPRSASPGARASAARARGPGRNTAAQLPTPAQWTRPYGLLRPVDEIAMLARRYMHEYGATRDHLFNVALACRNRANQNPAAVMYERPLTREMYMTSRWISEPLCLFDNCLETDGALACVIVSRRAGPRLPADARLRPLRRPGPARPAPRHGQLLERRPAHRARLDRRPAPVEARRLHSAGRGRRPDLRRVHRPHPAVAGGLRVLRAGRGRRLHRRGRPGDRRAAARQHRRAADSARPTSTASTSSTRASSSCAAPAPPRSPAPPPAWSPPAKASRPPRCSEELIDGPDSLLPRHRPDDGAPFWEYAAQGELRVQACADCGELRFPPRPCCPHCQSFACEWRQVERARPDLVVRRAAPAPAPRLRGAGAVQRRRRRARRGTAHPPGRQPRHRGPTRR